MRTLLLQVGRNALNRLRDANCLKQKIIRRLTKL
ncbi:Uncharacterised protein [Vibrio cholerae]|nr:Uncharacterised protein [Vibrio cholerae]CSH83363.1 Uncharacterised protein [Vibrio cholerae]